MFKYLATFALLILTQASACKATNDMTGEEIVKALRAGKAVRLTDKTIKGDLDFTNGEAAPLHPAIQYMDFSGTAFFERCTFEGKVIGFKKSTPAVAARFTGAFAFAECTFKQAVSFRENFFSDGVYLIGVSFLGEANFEGATFARPVTFQTCNFKGETAFQRARFASDFSATECVFDGITSFQRARFGGETLFAKPTTNAYTDFGGILAQGGFFFNGATVKDRLIFNNAEFQSRAEWMQGKFDGLVEMKNVVFSGKTRFNDSQFGGEWNLSETTFSVGKPVFQGVKVDKTKLTLTNAAFVTPIILKAEDF